MYIKTLIMVVLVLMTMLLIGCRPENGSVALMPYLTEYDSSVVFEEVSQFLKEGKQLTAKNINNLEKLGLVWGFLKYHHPLLQTGKYNWDNQLFGMLPKILKAKTNADADAILESWVDAAGAAAICKDCDPRLSDSIIKLKPDYGKLFEKNYLSASLTKKLRYLRDNYFDIKEPYYVKRTPVGNPEFINEPDHGSGFPNVSVRILALFRYWNIIQYYYPYRYLVKDWNTMLQSYLPKFIAAGNRSEYTLAFLHLITRLNDIHAGIYVNHILDSLAGKYLLPFTCEYIEGKVVVTDYIVPEKEIGNKIVKGDIIMEIKGVPIDSAIAHLLDNTSGTYYEEKVLYMLYPRGNSPLIRTNEKYQNLGILRNNKQLNVRVKTVLNDSVLQKKLSVKVRRPAYKILDESIGYIDAHQLADSDFAAVRQSLNNTKGLIIDLRNYPAVYMPILYAGWLKSVKTPFSKMSIFDLQKPGRFNYKNVYNGDSPGVPNGRKIPDTAKYQGKIILLVNSMTLSRGEYTAMALASVPGAKLAGSRTAGADGDVTRVPLPGDIETNISGVGIYYPDGKETQQVGLKIDIPVTRTIEGFEAGKDEVLEKAIEQLKK